MAPGSDRNSYYAPDAASAASWEMSFYDYPGSLNVPVVDPINPINEYVTYPHVTHIHILLTEECRYQLHSELWAQMGWIVRLGSAVGTKAGEIGGGAVVRGTA